MAQVIPCDTECGEVATCMLTLMDIAETKAFCGTCFADFATAYLQSVRPEALANGKPAPRPRKPKTAATAVADDKSGGESDAADATEPAGSAAG